MGLPRFTCPKGKDDESSPHLYVANCGPSVGLSYENIASVFGTYGKVKGVYAADESGTRVIVSYQDRGSAQSALIALNGKACSSLGGRSLHIQYSVQLLEKINTTESTPVSTSASDLNIPGLHLMHDFVSAKEEEVKDQILESCFWQLIVGHGNISPKEGFNIMDLSFAMMNVNTKQYLGELPDFVAQILERIRSCRTLDGATDISLDQLTVNEYPPGVGLSPHIDTHSAFEGSIFSLSLAGPCIMEFRRYTTGAWQGEPTSSGDSEGQISQNLNFVRKSIFLPPRSILLLSGESRYAWHHYIPHHKVDKVEDSLIPRGSRRVSFTLRKVRRRPCQCEFPQYCDSQE